MPLQLDDSCIRAQLHADLLTAWGTVAIYDGFPGTPDKLAGLPRAFVLLDDFEPQRARGLATAREAVVPHRYILTGQFPWPESGGIEEDKVARAQALLDRLTADTRYVDKWDRNVTAIRWEEHILPETQETIYYVVVEFEVEVITHA